MTAETFSKRIASFCFWLGIVSWVSSAYFFLIAPIEYVALGARQGSCRLGHAANG